MQVRRWAVAMCVLLAAGLLAPTAQASSGVVDADGQRQWISCKGKGSPTVVLINGLGSSHTIWKPLLGDLRKQGRVCVTDRPGTGSSPARSGSRRTDAGEHADELDAALRAAGESGPYVLVAHSYGGLVARAFAAQFPNDVAGMMLVDAVYPGIHRTFLPSYAGDWHEGGTTIDMDASERATRNGPDLGGTPLVVVTAGKPGNGSSWADRKWNRQQAMAATLSSISRHVFARRSGHVVQRDQPQVVVDGVEWIRAQFAA